jgi:hypothetical protein
VAVRLPGSGWLTSIRFERLAQALCTIPSTLPAAPLDTVIRTIWRACGGPYDEVSQLLTILQELALVDVTDGMVRRTRAGDKAVRSAKNEDLKVLGMILIRAGCFYEQARLLIESGEVDANGNLHCPTKLVRANAPQLLAVLRCWEAVRSLPDVLIPKELLGELNTVWALLPPPVELPSWAAERKEVGNRAEMYTVQFQRTRIGTPALVVWVAQDSDTLGWDVEDHSVEPYQYIEVKGRRDHDQIFFLSENEWKRANELGPQYHIHFWGGIDLARDPAVEYAALTASGYPFVIANLAAEIAKNEWEAAAVRWRVSRTAPVT